MSVSAAIEAIERFQGAALTESLARIEADIVGFDRAAVTELCGAKYIDDTFIASATAIKRVAG